MWLDNTTNNVSITIGGNLINNGYLEVKRVPGNGSGSVDFTVNGDITVSGNSAYFYGILQNSTHNYTGNFSLKCNNLTISSKAYFWGIYNGNGNATFNINGTTNISDPSNFYGIYADNSNNNYGGGTCTFNTNSLTLSNEGWFFGKYFNQTSIWIADPPSGDFNLKVSENLTIGNDKLTDCIFAGIYSNIDYAIPIIWGESKGNVDVTVEKNVIIRGTGQYFNFIGNHGRGSFNMNIGATLLLDGGLLRGNYYLFTGNYGITNLKTNNLDIQSGSILVHSADVTDGRTCLIDITNNATINFSNSNMFFFFSNLTGGTQNQIYNFRVGGNLTISGDGSAQFRTRTHNTSVTDFITVAGNLTVSGGQLLLASHKNNPLNCTIGGNVSISGGTINTSTHSSSKIDLTVGSSSITWSQTGGSVNLCNINIKSGKTVTLIGSKMGDFQSGRTLTVESGATLNCDIYPVTGAGNFTLSSNATLGIGHRDGIETTGAVGNIRVTGTRIYRGDATYRYYGSQSPQYTGNFSTNPDPKIMNIIIDKTNNTDKVYITKGSSGGNSFEITGNLNLINGGLFLNERTLSISGNPSAITRTNGYIVSETNTASNPSKLKWTLDGDNIYTIPFGTIDGYYIPVIIDAQNINILTISTRATSEDNKPWSSGVTSMKTITGISDGSKCCVIDRWWDIDVLGFGAKPKAKIGFSYLGRENTMDNPTNQLAIQHWTGSYWNDGNGGGNGSFFDAATYGGTHPTTTYTVTGEFTEFSPFVIVDKGNPLPVEIITFSSECLQNANLLTWQTTSESNNCGFTVQKSQNAIDWEDFGFVTGQGNSNYITTYHFTDNNPYYPITYYRLLQIDNDGTSIPLNIISANCNNSSSIVEDIIPFVKEGILNILIQGNTETNYCVTIVNLMGQVVYKQEVNLTEPSQYFSIKQYFTNGIYCVNMIGNNTYISKPFIVSK